MDENDKVSRWDANGGLEAENDAAESVRDEQKFLEQAGQVKINAIIKQKNHEFYVIKNDELIEFNKQEKGWNFKVCLKCLKSLLIL